MLSRQEGRTKLLSKFPASIQDPFQPCMYTVGGSQPEWSYTRLCSQFHQFQKSQVSNAPSPGYLSAGLGREQLGFLFVHFLMWVHYTSPGCRP